MSKPYYDLPTPRRVIAITGDTNVYPWNKGDLVTFMGELDNMKGHGVYFVGDRICTGYHLENFREPTEDEI